MNDAQQAAFELRIGDLRRLIKQGAELNGCLLSAASAHSPTPKKQESVIRLLVSAGSDVNETDANGVTPLHRAVRFRSVQGVAVLVSLGADVNARDRRSQSTPLHRCVTETGAPKTAGKGEVAAEIARFLLSNGADPQLRNKSGKTPLDYVKRPEMLDALNATR